MARLVGAVHAAGHAEMEIYRRGFTVEIKADASPVTQADRAAEAILLAALARIAPDIPVISEEAASAAHLPEAGGTFFLVDPLDGTKEFINKRDDFTVNVGLIENGTPVFGMVYAPARKQLFFTLARTRARLPGQGRSAPGLIQTSRRRLLRSWH